MDWLPAAHAQAPASSPGGRMVSGRVLDGDAAGQGAGLPGVTVRVAGTSLGAATGADGAFSIADVPATATQVQISFVGGRIHGPGKDEAGQRATRRARLAAARRSRVGQWSRVGQAA